MVFRRNTHVGRAVTALAIRLGNTVALAAARYFRIEPRGYAGAFVAGVCACVTAGLWAPPLLGQDVPASIELPAAPQLLSEAEVEQGLEIRGQQMRERYDARLERLLRGVRRTYDVVSPEDAAAFFAAEPDWEAAWKRRS